MHCPWRHSQPFLLHGEAWHQCVRLAEVHTTVQKSQNWKVCHLGKWDKKQQQYWITKTRLFHFLLNDTSSIRAYMLLRENNSIKRFVKFVKTYCSKLIVWKFSSSLTQPFAALSQKFGNQKEMVNGASWFKGNWLFHLSLRQFFMTYQTEIMT